MENFFATFTVSRYSSVYSREALSVSVSLAAFFRCFFFTDGMSLGADSVESGIATTTESSTTVCAKALVQRKRAAPTIIINFLISILSKQFSDVQPLFHFCGFLDVQDVRAVLEFVEDDLFRLPVFQKIAGIDHSVFVLVLSHTD